MSAKIEDGKTAKTRYNQKIMKSINVSCHVVNDKDILDYLSQKENKSNFIKELIRSYIKNNK